MNQKEQEIQEEKAREVIENLEPIKSLDAESNLKTDLPLGQDIGPLSIRIRYQALEIALKIVEPAMTVDSIIENAKKIESFLGFQ